MPVKIPLSYVFPTSVKEYTQLMDSLNKEVRKKWDKAYEVVEVLEKYPDDGGYIQ